MDVTGPFDKSGYRAALEGARKIAEKRGHVITGAMCNQREDGSWDFTFSSWPAEQTRRSEPSLL